MFVIRAEKHNPSAEHVFTTSSESVEHVARGLEAGDNKKFAIASLMNLEVTQFARNGARRGFRTELDRSRLSLYVSRLPSCKSPI